MQGGTENSGRHALAGVAYAAPEEVPEPQGPPVAAAQPHAEELGR